MGADLEKAKRQKKKSVFFSFLFPIDDAKEPVESIKSPSVALLMPTLPQRLDEVSL